MNTSEHHPRRKKILYVITKSNWGGAQKYVFDLATHFSTSYDVTVALGGDGTLAHKLKEKNIHVISLPWLQRDINPFLDIKSFFSLVSLFQKEKPDIIHLNSSKIGGIGAVAGRFFTGARIIFTGHGWAFNEDRSPISKILIKLAHWITIVFAHSTITVSEGTKKQMNWPFIQHKMHTVYNGVHHPDFLSREHAREAIISRTPALKAALANTQASGKTPFWIGTISELHPNKGLTYALDALRTLPHNFVFVVIGEGQERKNIEKLIDAHKLNGKVFLAGHVDEAWKYLKAFELFTLTSITEAFAYAIIEAGSAELPVIASDVGGISEIIAQMASGILIHPREVKEINEAVEYMIQYPEKAKKMAEALKQKIETSFSLKRMYIGTEAIYKR